MSSEQTEEKTADQLAEESRDEAIDTIVDKMQWPEEATKAKPKPEETKKVLDGLELSRREREAARVLYGDGKTIDEKYTDDVLQKAKDDGLLKKVADLRTKESQAKQKAKDAAAQIEASKTTQPPKKADPDDLDDLLAEGESDEATELRNKVAALEKQVGDLSQKTEQSSKVAKTTGTFFDEMDGDLRGIYGNGDDLTDAEQEARSEAITHAEALQKNFGDKITMQDALQMTLTQLEPELYKATSDKPTSSDSDLLDGVTPSTTPTSATPKRSEPVEGSVDQKLDTVLERFFP